MDRLRWRASSTVRRTDGRTPVAGFRQARQRKDGLRHLGLAEQSESVDQADSERQERPDCVTRNEPGEQGCTMPTTVRSRVPDRIRWPAYARGLMRYTRTTSPAPSISDTPLGSNGRPSASVRMRTGVVDPVETGVRRPDGSEVRRRLVTPSPLPPAPWPLDGTPSTCASARQPPCAAPRSSCAFACRQPWPPSSCRVRRPARRFPR